MSKSKTPLFSLGASGTVGNSLTFQRRSGVDYSRKKPVPVDRKTLKQIYHRWLYQDYVAYWHQQTQSTKQLWETNARPYHMTGFAYWMQYHLKNMPDIVGWWPLDDLVAGSTTDFSKNKTTASIIGASLVNGTIDHAHLFDGVDDYVNLGNLAIFNIPVFCFDFFCTFHAIQVWDLIISRGTWASIKPFIFGMGAGSQLYSAIECTGGSVTTYWGRWAQTDLLFHFGIQYSAATGLQNFIDGVEVTGAGPNGTPDYTSSLTLRLAASSTITNDLNATLDNFVIYNRLLQASDFKRHSERRYPL